ncbi:hypothetical protein [Paenibacillus sp. PK3_47]|uniref:hypothetical protein n=1 Tax=Paenibacillus sp. PK3_47 TaxID=2072642 RepID=UPI00201D728F|nr:hypothetical protein [Paenibacillus sp. PK3_47]
MRIEPRFRDNRLVGGKYHMGSHTVYLYKEEIIRQCCTLFGSTDRLKEYIAVILAHELGHSEDTELVQLADALERPVSQREEAEIRLRIEQNAWAYAEALLSDTDSAFLQLIIEESLLSYRNTLQLHIA